MVALTGESYEELPNAYRYRAECIDNCACKPKPWSLEAKAEYHRRAVVAGMSKEERIVAAGADAVARVLAGSIAIAEAPVGSARYARTEKTQVKARTPRDSLIDRQKEAGQPPRQSFFRFLFGKRQNTSNRALTVGEPALRKRQAGPD